MTGWTTLTIVLVVAAAAAVAAGIAIWFYTRTLYRGPWYLLIGPADAGRGALLAGARQQAAPRRMSTTGRGSSGLAWHYFESGAIVDVPSHIVFPLGDPDAIGWERALRVLKRYRPRRPVDGIILAVPATMLSDADWLSRAHDIGATLRDRLLQAQRYFGFALPVYLIVTHCESIRGFTAFTRALPESLLPSMLGWSNPRAGDESFTAASITEGFSQLHRAIVLAQVELFATRSEAGDDSSDLLLFSRDVTRLVPPLRALLEEVFRPGLHHESFFFRGFYLCGEGAPASTVVDVLDSGLSSAIVTTTASPAVFVSDLFEWKMFPERGLARPLPGRVRARRRAVWIARGAVAVLALALIAGSVWGYMKARRARDVYASLLTFGGSLLAERHELRRSQRGADGGDRLAQSRQFAEQLQAVGPHRLGSLFLPASLVRSLDERASGLVTAVFGDVVLGDFRDGLTERAETWLAPAPATDVPVSVGGPALKDNPFYQRLERFASDYQSIVGGIRRYDQLAGGRGPDDLSGASDLLGFLTGVPLTSPALSPQFGRAVQAARGAAIGCEMFAGPPGAGSLVELRASELLDQFGAAAFGDSNPVLEAGAAFSEDWTALMDGTDEPGVLLDLMDDATLLSAAVSAWGPIGTRSQALAIPVFAQPPFKRLPADDRLCAALRPDVSPALARVAALRDRLSARLLELGALDPFGPLVEAGEKGLVLNAEIATLKTDLDGLRREVFWAPPPVESSGFVPSNPVWRPEVFDEVVKVADGFEIYRARAFGGLAVADRQRLLRAVRREVARLVSARLVVTAAPGGNPAVDPQQRAEELTALGAQLAKAGRLVPLLASDSTYGAEVLRALDQQTVRALQDLDRLAASRYPAVFGQQYAAASARWADVLAASAPADALKQWAAVVDEQREGTQQLARLAVPLVQFVSPRQQPEVVRRWGGVVADVGDYDQKRPGNGFSTFDAAFRETLSSIAPEKGCVAPAVRARADGRYFPAVQTEIVNAAVRRCRTLVEERYRAIAADFNQRLGDRPPFRVKPGSTAEATAEQVAAFLRTYDRQAGRSLRPALEARGCSADAVAFMRRLESIDALLGGMRAQTPPVAAIDVAPEFRIESPQDAGADQIGNWELQVGAQTFVDGVAAKPAPWKAGDPVALTLRFARDSPNRPVRGPSGSQVQERLVRLDFSGPWALLHLVRAGRTAVDGIRVAEFEPTVLTFEITVERDPATPPLGVAAPPSPFTASMRLRLYPPGKTDPVPLDDLPSHPPAALVCSDM